MCPHGRTCRGREIRRSEEDSIIAVFTEAAEVMACAVEIQTELLKRSDPPEDDTWDINFRIGISGGQSVTEGDHFLNKSSGWPGGSAWLPKRKRL